MAKRKQASKKGRFALLRGLARSTGELIARNPSVAGGATVFGVTFAFVAINALVHQPATQPKAGTAYRILIVLLCHRRHSYCHLLESLR